MNIRNISETYTNLGQLNRGSPQVPERPFDLIPRDQPKKEAEPTALVPVGPAKVKAPETNDSPLSLAEAQLLTDFLADDLLEAGLDACADLHDPFSVRLVPDRYV